MRAAIAWPSSLPQKYSVNPNGELRNADSRRVGRREHRMPVELVETQLQGALPLHLVASDGWEAAGLAPFAVAWAKANGFSGEAGRTLAVPGENGALAGALFGTGDGEGAL